MSNCEVELASYRQVTSKLKGVKQMICENCKFKDDCGWYESYKRIKDEIIIGIGTDNTVGKALFNTIEDNQLEECEYFE